MPHIIIKMWPGKTEKQKTDLTDRIVKEAMGVLGCGEESLSVAIEVISSDDWTEQVYNPEIKDKWDELYKKPGY